MRLFARALRPAVDSVHRVNCYSRTAARLPRARSPRGLAKRPPAPSETALYQARRTNADVKGRPRPTHETAGAAVYRSAPGTTERPDQLTKNCDRAGWFPPALQPSNPADLTSDSARRYRR